MAWRCTRSRLIFPTGGRGARKLKRGQGRRGGPARAARALRESPRRADAPRGRPPRQGLDEGAGRGPREGQGRRRRPRRARPRRAAAKPAKAPAAATPKEKTAAAATAKGKKELGLLLPEEVAREKTLDQIAETREKKKEARALRGMAGNTKNEVKKYKAQEKALDKKLAALAKSKRQQDARVARAKGRAAKAKQRAAKVEKEPS